MTAYREGAAPLATAIEAQRNAREILAQYIDDLAAAWIATAALRVAVLVAARSATDPSVQAAALPVRTTTAKAPATARTAT